MEAKLLLEGLTPEQQKAVETLKENQEGRLFVGYTPETIANDFREANKLHETHPEKAKENAQALFALCGYTPE